MDRDVYSKIIAKIKSLGEKINNLEPSDEKVGDLEDLETTNKSDVVSAINEIVDALSDVDDKIGSLSNLTTTEKTNIVSAINELVTSIGAISSVGGVFISRQLRADTGYNDITMTSFLNSGTGIIITSKGVFPFYSTANGVATSASGLTIAKQGDTDVYRFTCDGDWYKFSIIMTSWDYTAGG